MKDKKYFADKHQERMKDVKRKKEFIKVKKDRRERLSLFIQAIKAAQFCANCGETDPICLDFHHKDPKKKKFSIANSPRLGHSEEVIFKEIKKCVVICKNCHARLHRDLRDSDKPRK